MSCLHRVVVGIVLILAISRAASAQTDGVAGLPKSQIPGEENLSRNPAADRDPAWSPDGKRIVFVSDRDGNFEIYVMLADGSHQTRLTSNASAERNPRWSKDGKQIVFQSNRDGNEEIYVMNADGSRQTRLTNNSSDDMFPDVSP